MNSYRIPAGPALALSLALSAGAAAATTPAPTPAAAPRAAHSAAVLDGEKFVKREMIDQQQAGMVAG